MRTLFKILIPVAILGGAVAAAYQPVKAYWEERNRPEFRTEQVDRGDVVSFVLATGKIQPVEKILVGAPVSGPIIELPSEIDFNAEIKKGDLMAVIDPRLYTSRVEADEASLEIRKAEVARAEAQLAQAQRAERRAIELRKRNRDYVSDAEMDQLKYSTDQLAAALKIAEASVIQAEANLVNSRTNLEYTEIKAPKDGIIIDRKIDPGQTLAAAFQAPELFEIGIEMRERMHIYASVDENDIGLIQEAQETNQPVTFTVSAYPEALFEGNIVQIRMSSSETQAVVTYPVIVEAPNPDLKLLPGMTANISFQVEKHADALRIPNAALRYYPDKKHVRSEDHGILDGSAWGKASDEEDQDANAEVSSETVAERRRKRHDRHVWILENDLLRAVPIRTGILDRQEGARTELVSGDLSEGQAVVVGLKPKKGLFGG